MQEAIPETMSAVLLTGHGGYDKLEFHTDVPVPVPDDGEVLIKVAAAGVNNTDINTRTAWYSKSVTSGTASGGAEGFAQAAGDDGSWSGSALQFPRIQGADACGHIVNVGPGVDPRRLGERVIVRTMSRAYNGYQPFMTSTFGSEFDGGFAQYAKIIASEAFHVNCDWSDAELASVPCAYSTAEGMLQRAQVVAENVLVTGASGGVGSAAVQLAKYRGAKVVAVTAASKAGFVRDLGADRILERDVSIVEALGEDSVDVVVDVVGGPAWVELLQVLRRGGRYVTSGAIAGPIVELDLRTLYLKDLSLIGSTFQEDSVFDNVIRAIETNSIRPVVSKTYPLADIVQAQQDFNAKIYPGKLVLIP